MRSKKVAVSAAVAGASLLLAGCGGSGPSLADGPAARPQDSAAPTASAAPSPSISATPATGSGKDATMTDLRARMLAVAGVLKAEDLPGYTAEVDEEDADDIAFDQAMYKCLGVAEPTYLAENPGKNYTKDAIEIGFTVDVVRTAKEALADLRVIATDKGESCLKQTYAAMFKAYGVTGSGVTVDLAPVTVPGADDAFRVRYGMTLSGPAGKITLSGWSVAALVDHTQISVDLSSEDGSTPKLSRAVELAELAVKRVREAQTAPESDADPEVAHLGKVTGPQRGA